MQDDLTIRYTFYLLLAQLAVGLVKWLYDRNVNNRVEGKLKTTEEKIDENTNISKEAFTAANNYNLKLLLAKKDWAEEMKRDADKAVKDAQLEQAKKEP